MFDAFDDDDLDFDDNQDVFDAFLKPEADDAVVSLRNVETDNTEPQQLNRSLNLGTNPVVKSKKNFHPDDSFEKLFAFGEEGAASTSSFRAEGFREGRSETEEIVSPMEPKEVIQRVKRKFPGPAGVLPVKRLVGETHRSPRLSKYNSPKNKGRRSMESPSIKPSDNELGCCTQSSQDVFQKKSWLSMKRDLERNDGIIANLDKFNIADVLKKASRNLLPGLKAPLLCLVLQSINFSGEYASAVFRDPSGEMSGWVDRLILKEYGSWIQPGCVLVLKQTSVLSVSSRKHYLNVHPTNIVQIYRSDCANDEGQVVSEKMGSNEFWNDLIREAEESLSKSPSVGQTSTGIRNSKCCLKKKDCVLLRLQSHSAATSSSVIEDVCRREKPSDKRINVVQRPQLRANSKETVSDQRIQSSSTTLEEFCSLGVDDLWNDDEFESLLQHIDTESSSLMAK